MKEVIVGAGAILLGCTLVVLGMFGVMALASQVNVVFGVVALFAWTATGCWGLTKMSEKI